MRPLRIPIAAQRVIVQLIQQGFNLLIVTRDGTSITPDGQGPTRMQDPVGLTVELPQVKPVISAETVIAYQQSCQLQGRYTNETFVIERFLWLSS